MKDPKDTQTIDAFEKKAMTAAERKAKQRAAMKDKARLDCYISIKHKAMLDELRTPHFSIEQMVEKLIEEEHREMKDQGSLYNESFKNKIKRLRED